MIVITHLATCFLNFIWQYFKNRDKMDQEKNAPLKNVGEQYLSHNLSNFGDEINCKEISVFTSDNLQHNFVRGDDLKNKSYKCMHKEAPNPNIDCKTNTCLQDSRCKIEEETIALSGKSIKVETSSYQSIFMDDPRTELVSTDNIDNKLVDSLIIDKIRPVKQNSRESNTTEYAEANDMSLNNQVLSKSNISITLENTNICDCQCINQSLDPNERMDINYIKPKFFEVENDNTEKEQLQGYSLSKDDNFEETPIAEDFKADKEEKTNIRFYPPVFVQRYVRAGDILDNKRWKDSIKKIVEFGCGEMTFFTMVLKYKQMTELIEVDVDFYLLERYINKIFPKPSDYLSQRTTPLVVKAYSGNVAQIHNCLMDADAVIAIELIEHLYPNDLEALPFTIFGFMQPKIAVFTTPNADFNVLFPDFSGFRHYDHKFEWTREQFEDWGKNLTSRYPDYDVSFEGIGVGPEGTDRFGCCSQMALFVRKTDCKTTVDISEHKDLEGEYKLVSDAEYPFYVDTRTEEQKILDSAENYIYHYQRSRWQDDDDERNDEIPLNDIHAAVKCLSIARLRDILVKGNWNVMRSSTGELVVKCPGTEEETSDWEVNKDDEDNCEVTLTSEYIEEDWDDLDNEKPPANEQTLQQSEDTIDSFFKALEEIESSKNVEKSSANQKCNSGSNTPLESESNLNKSTDSFSDTMQESSICGNNVEDTFHGTKQYSLTPNAICSLPTYQNVIDVTYTPLNTKSKISENSCIYKNCPRLSDIFNDDTVSDSDVSFAYKSCIDGDESDQFYTPLPALKHLKGHGPVHSFKSVNSTNDLNESEDSLSLSDNNISFTYSKSQMPKCHSCPGSRHSVSALELQRGNSCDVLACHPDNMSISKAVDSGYPNSEQTMDMDLTPEQVDELVTESDSSLGCEDDNSLPESPVNLAVGQVIALLGDNVENGDVANNNRDGEGNNMMGEIDGELLEFVAVINEREEVHPLLAAVEGDLDSSDNELVDENSEQKENEEPQTFSVIDKNDGSRSCLSSTFNKFQNSDLIVTKSEPALSVKGLEKRVNRDLSSSVSDETIGVKIINDNIKTIPTATSLINISENNSTCSNLNEPRKLESHFVEEGSDQISNLSPSQNPNLNTSVTVFNAENDNTQDFSPLSSSSFISNNSNSQLCNVINVTKLESAVNKSPLDNLIDEQLPTSNCDHTKYDLESTEPECYEQCNKKLEQDIVGQYSGNPVVELESSVDEETNFNDHLLTKNIRDEFPLAASSPVSNDLVKTNVHSSLHSNQNGTNPVQLQAQKSMVICFDELSSISSDQGIGNELFNNDIGEWQDLTPLPSTCAIIEDLSAKDSQMTLCSEISSTFESSIFETSSESSFHGFLPSDSNSQLESDIQIPEGANPFPEWLLSIFNSSTEDNYLRLGFGDIEESSDSEDEERELSYDVEGDLGGAGDPDTSQS